MEINGTTIAPKSAPTGSYTHFLRVNQYDYAQTAPAKKLTGAAKKLADAAQAIIDTIKYLGWMSLKDSDHNEYGKGIGQGAARRTAADRMIADGRIVLLGTWSNGIAVGPGAAFVRATAQESAPAPKKSTRKARKPVFRMIDTEYEEARAQEDHDDVLTGSACAWAPTMTVEERPIDTAPAMHGPAYVPKPRVRYTWPKVATMKDMPLAKLNMRQRQEHEEHHTGEFCEWQPGIRLQAAKAQEATPTPIYEPAVGESIFIVLRHENGTTTDRVVDVQRVKVENGRVVLFRGYDRRRDRCRNYQVADCLIRRAWDGCEVMDMSGRVVVEGRNAA